MFGSLKDDVSETCLALQRFGREHLTGNKVWLPSFIVLGAADVASLSRSTSAVTRGLEVIGAGAGVGLIAASSYDLAKAETAEQKLDAGSDLLWGAQGLLYLSQSGAAGRVALALGVLGSIAQTASGAKRVRDGIVREDGRTVKLGALDLGGGLLWLAWDLIGWHTPLFVGSYLVLMIGREAYANQEAVQRAASKLEAKLRCLTEGVRQKASVAVTSIAGYPCRRTA